MATTEEAFLAGLGALAALLYLWVARLQSRRTVSPEAQGALRGFVIWWVGLGALGLLGLYTTFGPDAESFGLNGFRVWIYAIILGIYVILAGLVYYLVYLYTGQRKSLFIIVAYYCLLALLLVWLIEGFDPHIADNTEHLEPGEEGEVVFHTHQDAPTWASAAFSLGLILPPLLAAVAYALLFFRIQDRTARYRIAMVSGGFVLWFAFSTVSTITRLVTDVQEQGFFAQLTGQLLGVLAAALTLMAYDPPKWLQRRFGLRSVQNQTKGKDDVFGEQRKVTAF